MENLSKSESRGTAAASKDWLLFGFIFAAGLLLRWLQLDAKPIHHDESLHLMYGWYFFDHPDTGFYQYSAMLHGPLLYNLLRLAYNTLGVSAWAGRALVALLGSLFIFAPLLFRRYMSRQALLALTTAIALSPTLIYWSRFLREDMLQLSLMLLTLIGVLLVDGGKKIFVVLLSVTLQFCEKENSYVSLAILLGYLVFEWGFNAVVHRDSSSGLLQIGRYVWRHKWAALVAAALSALVYCYLFSAGFRYPKGILDGLWRESLSYWIKQHSIERIEGPFLFHFYSLSWYETLFVAAFIFQLAVFYRRASLWARVCGACVLVAALGCAVVMHGEPVRKIWPWTVFKAKDHLDVFAIFVVLFHPIILTIEHLYRREKALAFWGYFFTASFFSYSFLGEKVPWLSVYPFLPGLVYLTLYFDDFFRKTPLPDASAYPWSDILRLVGVFLCTLGLIFVFQEGLPLAKLSWKGPPENWTFLACGALILLLGFAEMWLKVLPRCNLKILGMALLVLFNLRASILTNFVHAGKATEFISQVHTTDDFHKFALKLGERIRVPLDGVKPQVLDIEAAVWPLVWYLLNQPEFKFSASPEERKTFDYIFQNYKDDLQPPAGFRSIKLPLRGWWVPDYTKMTLRSFLNYALNHTPWSPTGFSDLAVWIKVDTRNKDQTD